MKTFLWHLKRAGMCLSLLIYVLWSSMSKAWPGVRFCTLLYLTDQFGLSQSVRRDNGTETVKLCCTLEIAGILPNWSWNSVAVERTLCSKPFFPLPLVFISFRSCFARLVSLSLIFSSLFDFASFYLIIINIHINK